MTMVFRAIYDRDARSLTISCAEPRVGRMSLIRKSDEAVLATAVSTEPVPSYVLTSAPAPEGCYVQFIARGEGSLASISMRFNAEENVDAYDYHMTF